MGLLIPRNGIVRRGQGQCVTVRGANGEDVVALVHAEAGDRKVLILPDGRLESVSTDETRPTSEPFRPATKDELAQQLTSGTFKDFKSRNTAHYLFVYNSSDRFYKGTSRILETMYPAIVAYFKRLKIPVHDPSVPLVAVIFRTEKEFRKFEEVPPRVMAYYSIVSNQIVMYEQSDLVEIAPELAVKQSIGTIAHEGVHQILHNIGVQQRLSRWPMWISEGLAEYFAPTSVDRRLRWKGVGQPHDLRMHELDAFLKQPGRRGEMVEDVVGASRLTSTGYAAAWSLTHYLASRQREKFRQYVREVAKLGPLEPRGGVGGADPKALFAEHFGSDYVAIEDALVEHLRRLPYVDPIANQTHYVVSLQTTTSRTVGVTSSPSNVRKWQQESLVNVPSAMRAKAQFQIMPFPNKRLAEAYAKRLLGTR